MIYTLEPASSTYQITIDWPTGMCGGATAHQSADSALGADLHLDSDAGSILSSSEVARAEAKRGFHFWRELANANNYPAVRT